MYRAEGKSSKPPRGPDAIPTLRVQADTPGPSIPIQDISSGASSAVDLNTSSTHLNLMKGTLRGNRKLKSASCAMLPPLATAPHIHSNHAGSETFVKPADNDDSNQEFVGPIVSSYRNSGGSCTTNPQSSSRNVTPLRLDPLPPNRIRHVPDTHLDTASPCPSEVSEIHLNTTRQNSMVPDQEFPPVRQTDNWSGRRVLPPVSARDVVDVAPQPHVSFNTSSANSLSPYNLEGSPSNSSLASRNQSAYSYTRQAKKRALSISPISIDNIRTSPTSLVAYINGGSSQSSSPLFGSQGHLTAMRCSPNSRGSSSESSMRKGNFLHSNAHKHHQVLMQEIMENQMTTRRNIAVSTIQPPMDMKTEPGGTNSMSPSKPTIKVDNTNPGSVVAESPAAEAEEESEDQVCRWTECNLTFSHRDELVRHIEKAHIDHRKGEEFTCFWENCTRHRKPFNARYKLLIHMRVHSGEKPNKCTFEGCTKAFSRLENLKIHLRSHTGERPYKCTHPKCKKAFSNSSDRAKHYRTHEDTKPYACDVPGCIKRYTDPSSLRKHQKSHTKEEQDARKKLKAIKESAASSTDLNNLLSVKKFSNSPLPPTNNDNYDMHFGANAHCAGQGNVNLAELNYMMQSSHMEDPQQMAGAYSPAPLHTRSESHIHPYMNANSMNGGSMMSMEHYPPPPYPGLSTQNLHQQQMMMHQQQAWHTDQQWQAWQQQQQQQQQMEPMPPTQQSLTQSAYFSQGVLSCAQEAAMAASGAPAPAYGGPTLRQLSPRQIPSVNVDEHIPYLTPDTQVQAYKLEPQVEGYEVYQDPQLLERQGSTLSSRARVQQPMFSVDGGGM